MMINDSTSTSSNGSTRSSSNNSRPETEAAAHYTDKSKTVLRYVPSTDPGSSTLSSRSATPSSSNQPPRNDPDSAAGSGSSNRSQAAFVNKLYKMLEDPDIQHLISWSEGGDLFSVTNPTSFSRSVLPQYFKHNNWQSFVRQLNMYGFHKVNDMIHSNLTSEVQNWEFKHPHFRRGAVDDLKNIKRKSAKSRHQYQQRLSSPLYPNDNDEYVYGPMYKHIVDIEDRLHHVHKAYEVLYKETLNLKSIISGQQEIITDLANVILSVCRQDQSNIAQGPQVEKIAQELQRLKDATAVIPSLYSQAQDSTLPPTSSITGSSPLPSTAYPPLPRQPQRLPSISAVQGQSHLDNLDAHTLNPPVGYSESASSSIHSPSSKRGDELQDRKPKISLLSIPPGSPPRKLDYPEEKKDARPPTEFLGLGSHSQLLNPAPSNFDERYSDRKQKGVKRNLPDDF